MAILFSKSNVGVISEIPKIRGECFLNIISFPGRNHCNSNLLVQPHFCFEYFQWIPTDVEIIVQRALSTLALISTKIQSNATLISLKYLYSSLGSRALASSSQRSSCSSSHRDRFFSKFFCFKERAQFPTFQIPGVAASAV